jgi:D-alanine--poly(phosphoribitol) ligase subunit 2
LTDANAIIERIGAVFVESFHIEVPSPDTDLLESGILDSFQFVELLVQLEQRFGLRIKIDDIDLDDLRTLSRIARLVAANGAAADPAAARPPSDAAA